MAAGDKLEIWRSTTDLADSSFYQIADLDDGALPILDTDSSVHAGALYIYRARRYRPSTTTYSAWSAPVYAVAAYIGGVPMSQTATGVQTLLGIGREGTYGHPVMAQKLLDRKSGSPEITFQDPDHEVLRNITADIESVPGTSKVEGTVKLTATPEGLSRPLQALLGDPATVTTAPVVGPPAVSAYQTHTYKDGFNQIPHTLTELKGPMFVVYEGTKAMGLTVSLDKTQNMPVEFDFDFVCLNKWYSDAMTSIGLDTAGMDSLPAFGPIQGALSILGAVTDSAKQATFNLKKQYGDRQVLNGVRGPVEHFCKKTEVTGTASLYFDTDENCKIFFGQLDAAAVPYGASKTIRTVPFQLDIVSQINANGYANLFELLCPRVTYKKVGEQVNGPDEIMQAVEWKAYQDPGIGSPFQVRVVNSETLAALTTAGTAIAVVPSNGVQLYHNP